MPGRYRVEGNWTESLLVNAAPKHLIIEDCDLADTRTGTVYPDGAIRVRLLRPVRGFRNQTFKGETARMKAENLADRIANELRRVDT